MDAALRALERRWRQTGAPVDEQAYLAACRRSTLESPLEEALRVAGEPAAWVEALPAMSARAQVAALLAVDALLYEPAWLAPADRQAYARALVTLDRWVQGLATRADVGGADAGLARLPVWVVDDLRRACRVALTGALDGEALDGLRGPGAQGYTAEGWQRHVHGLLRATADSAQRARAASTLVACYDMRIGSARSGTSTLGERAGCVTFVVGIAAPLVWLLVTVVQDHRAAVDAGAASLGAWAWALFSVGFLVLLLLSMAFGLAHVAREALLRGRERRAIRARALHPM